MVLNVKSCALAFDPSVSHVEWKVRTASFNRAAARVSMLLCALASMVK